MEKGNPILDKAANAVDLSDIKTSKIQTIIANMQETLAAIDDGVGLAAPQVNIPLQIFIVSKRVLKGKDKLLDKDIVCINPKIVKFSKTKKWLDGEGCLSVRWFYGRVFRSTNVTMEYFDEFGQKQSRGAGGLLAHIFQHECDHLKGELFIDKAKDIEYLDPNDHE
ncbi:peptide deformylase [Candidatus Parcubacteria bacterium]|nr:peptide deformylase [Candidatus Parcubacteria bacterium]